MKRLFAALLGLFFLVEAAALSAFDKRMLAAGTPYYGTISWAHDTVWPDAPARSMIAALIEKESRWNPRAELCVPKPTCARERGVGLGQFTITPRFNVFHEVARMHPLLHGWPASEYHNPQKQILGIVLKTRMHYRQCQPIMIGQSEIMACAASSYNGGHGGVLADRRLCGNTKGCNPNYWFSHVERTSLKAKVPLTGYGQSFFQINRAYARGLVYDWRPKYVPKLGS